MSYKGRYSDKINRLIQKKKKCMCKALFTCQKRNPYIFSANKVIKKYFTVLFLLS